MSDNNTPGDGGDVIDFARRTGRTGFNLTPTLTLDPPVIPPPSQPSPAPDTTPSRGRRSPLDILNALPEPGLTQPVITPTTPAPAPAPGQVPDTFRSEPGLDDSIGPRLGALSLAAILAVAVAALRGAHTVASSWWERRQARYAETAQLREARLKHQLAMQNIGDKAAQQRAKTNGKVPSSSEFGRKTLGGRGGKGGASSDSGSGSGQSRKSPTGSGGTGPKRKNTPKGPGTGSGGSGTGGLGGGKRRKDRGNGGLLSPKSNTKSPKQPRNRTDKNTNGGRGGADRPGKTKNRPGLGPLSLLKQRRNKNNGTSLQKKQPNPKQQGPKVNLRKNPRTPNAKQQAPATGRLNRMKNAAARWWKNQQRNTGKTTPAGTTNVKNSRNNPKQNGPANPGNATKRNTRRTGQGQQWTRAWWARVRARAQKNTGKPGPSGPGGRQAPGPGSGQTPGGPSAGPGAGPGNTGRTRRSPFQNAGQATAATNPAYTVERDDYPGAQAKTWQPDALTAGQPVLAATGPAALTPAPGRYPKRPGTTRPRSPIPMPPAPVPARTDPRLVKARNQAARAAQQTVGRTMDARHETEITLDDACDAADQLAEDAFKTHDQSRRLAEKARNLRDTWLLFAEDLATNHNLIGALFVGASVRFAESMELVARMADEMETSSLEAAEKAETAGNEINDAYRPYNIAAADAGLSTPSAPIHNET